MLLTWLYTPSLQSLTRIQKLHSKLNYAAHICHMHVFCDVFIFDHLLDLIQNCIAQDKYVSASYLLSQMGFHVHFSVINPCDLSELNSSHFQRLLASSVESSFIHRKIYKLYRSNTVPALAVEYLIFIHRK